MEPIPQGEIVKGVFSPRTLSIMEFLARRAATDEWESEQTRVELQNFANELRARLQRVARGE